MKATAGLDLSTWMFTAGVGYDVIQSDGGQTGRSLRFPLYRSGGEFRPEYPEIPQVHVLSGFQDLLDATIVIWGYISLKRNWYLPYYANVETGDCDVRYQLFGCFGNWYSWGDIWFGYRHFCIEKDDDKLMQDMTINGPVAGVGFRS